MPRIDANRQTGETEQTYYRWKKKHDGMGTEQLKELKRLQKENDPQRRAVSDLALEETRHDQVAGSMVNVPLGVVHGFTFEPNTRGWIVALAANS